MLRIAINGFGRIGRNALKAGWLRREIEFVAVNDLAGINNMAYLLQYDTVYGRWPHEVHADGNTLVIDKKKIAFTQEKEPAKLPWKKLKIDVVIESTGRFTNAEGLRAHIAAGSRRVVLSAPAKGGGVPTFVVGVNDKKYKGEEILNNASCTTNCVTPVAAVIHNAFGVRKAAMTTVHGVTAEQALVDTSAPPLHKDFRRGRSAMHNIVPTSTGAAIATGEVITELKGLFDGVALRVPVLAGSIVDFTFIVKKKTTAEAVNTALRRAAALPPYKGILEVSDDQLVSSDILGTSASAIVDAAYTKVIDHDLVKILAWYDNEWAYSHRLIDMAIRAGRSI